MERRKRMPHIVVKMYPGRTEEQKQRLTEAIVKAVTSTIGCAEGDVSVGIEEVAPEDWQEKVYKPEIAGKADTLYKKPEY